MLPSYRLVVKAGPNVGKSFPLEKPEIFIGRDLNNDVVINDPEVSRRHARLVMQGGTFVFEDLGSTNGSFIKGQRLSGPYMLTPGEMITFGERINVLFDSVTAAAAAQTIPDAQVEPLVQPAPVIPPAPARPPVPAEPPAYRPAPPPAPVYPPQPPAYQQPAPQQPVYPPQAPAYQQPPAPQRFDPYQQVHGVQPPPYAGQVPVQPPVVKKVVPVWMWILLAVLLLAILVLAIDDFNLWYLFGF